jgi:serine/threonine protein kinase
MMIDSESRFIPIPTDDNEKGETFIGEGSTSLCYKVRYDDKWYVKKILKPELKDSHSYQQTLIKEYELGSQLDCPFIVHYSDLGEDDNGTFILTDFVDGKPLDIFIKDHPDYFKSRAARKLFISELLAAVDCLHQHQILHLDIKPSNIMITKVGNHVKLIDIGFAYQDCYTTSIGGTKGYSTPEQFDGQHPIGTYSDIYAIGSILEEVHLGRKKVISKCHQEEPSKRYQSVAQLRKDIFDNTLYYILIAASLVVIILGFGLYRHHVRHYQAAKYSIWKMNIDTVSKMHVRTIIVDDSSQPPLVGGYIENYASNNIQQKGLLLSNDSNELFITDTLSINTYCDSENHFYLEEPIFNSTIAKIQCTPINKEEFCISLQNLCGNTDYYVKAYILTKQQNCIYGKTKKIHTKDFNRYPGPIDVANVFYTNSAYDVFDLMTDEIIDIKKDGFYYSSNEHPKICKMTNIAPNDFYKYKTRWNYQLWYSHMGTFNPSWKSYDNKVYVPVMEIKDGKLYISKNSKNAKEDIDFYYTIDGDRFRPENFKLHYTGPITVTHPCLVSCYGRRKDGCISYTGYYRVMRWQVKKSCGAR